MSEEMYMPRQSWTVNTSEDDGQPDKPEHGRWMNLFCCFAVNKIPLLQNYFTDVRITMPLVKNIWSIDLCRSVELEFLQPYCLGIWFIFAF